MGRRGLDPLPAEMVSLRGRIEEWRRTRSGICSMPADLWARATEIASRRGVYATARGVGVEYGALARRVKSDSAAGCEEVAFVEWNGADLLGKVPAAGTVVEMSDPAGRQVTVRLAPGEGVDVAGLVAAFCGSRL